MNDIDREIQELEELIRLQRIKCDLLHRKNTNSRSTEVSPTASVPSPIVRSQDRGEETKNILHQKESEDIGVGSRISNNVRSLLMSTTEFDNEKEESGRKSESQCKKDSSDGKPEIQLVKPGDVFTETQEDRFVNAITRLSRLNTDLANERNLLAWGRTALACARTFLAFVGVDAVTNFGKVSRQVCYLGFSIMSVYIILQGTERYNKIKRIVYLKDPPAHFDRLTNAPLPICLTILFLLGLMSISFDQWEN